MTTTTTTDTTAPADDIEAAAAELRTQLPDLYREGRRAAREDYRSAYAISEAEARRRYRAAVVAANHPRTWQPLGSARNAVHWLGYADQLRFYVDSAAHARAARASKGGA